MNKEKAISILNQYDLDAQKRYGQNFLCDEDVIQSIIDVAQIQDNCDVLEIGPGIGALTEKVAAMNARFLCVEIDSRFKSHLSDVLSGENQCLLIRDYLETSKKDMCACIEGFSPEVVLSNLPYYIMTPLILKVISDFSSAQRMVFMVEEEALARIFAQPSTKEYGPLSVVTSVFGKNDKCFTVPCQSFIPAPHTTSAVISLTCNGSHRVDEAFVSFVEAAFSLRRKTMMNSLSSSGKYGDKKQILSVLESVSIPENVRAEALSPNDFVRIFDAMNQK